MAIIEGIPHFQTYPNHVISQQTDHQNIPHVTSPTNPRHSPFRRNAALKTQLPEARGVGRLPVPSGIACLSAQRSGTR